MIENIEALKPKDKLFMIYNRSSFSYPTQTVIDMHREEWLRDIDAYITRDLKEQMATSSRNMYESINERMMSFYKDIANLPSETKENISDLIMGFMTAFNKLMKDHSIQEYVKNEIDYFFGKVLLRKITAHEIMMQTSFITKPNNEHQYIFSYACLRHLIEEFNHKYNIEYTAVVIYLITSYLKMENSKVFADFLVNIAAIRFDYDRERLATLVSQMLSGDVTALKTIDTVTDVKNISNWSNDIVGMGKNILIGNYEKNKVCDRLNHGGLCIGDNCFPESMHLNELVIELDKLSIDTIKDYVSENQTISFGIDERTVGYLKVREGLPICKVLMPKTGFYTITKYQDVTYLLFTLYGDQKIYGISFPSGFQGVRKLVMFEIPKNLDYKLDEI